MESDLQFTSRSPDQTVLIWANALLLTECWWVAQREPFAVTSQSLGEPSASFWGTEGKRRANRQAIPLLTVSMTSPRGKAEDSSDGWRCLVTISSCTWPALTTVAGCAWGWVIKQGGPLEVRQRCFQAKKGGDVSCILKTFSSQLLWNNKVEVCYWRTPKGSWVSPASIF